MEHGPYRWLLQYLHDGWLFSPLCDRVLVNSDLSTLDMSDIYSLVLVQWDRLALGHHFHLNWRHILLWASDHPAVTRLTLVFLQGAVREKITSEVVKVDVIMEILIFISKDQQLT